jgi:hypothetical protein
MISFGTQGLSKLRPGKIHLKVGVKTAKKLTLSELSKKKKAFAAPVEGHGQGVVGGEILAEPVDKIAERIEIAKN